MATTAIRSGHTNGRHAAAAPTWAAQNVNDMERWASIAGGGALALYGLSRSSVAGALLAALGGGLLYRGLTGRCSMYAALGISTAPPHGPATSVPAGKGVKMQKSIQVNRPAMELYRFWRNLGNVPKFMRHIQSVTTEGNWSRWVAHCPVGFNLQWDAEIINDKPPEVIAWRSLPGSQVDSAGSVHFQPASNGAGTRVTVILKYDPPAGRFGAALAELFGHHPEAQLEEDLRRFKQLMETSETAKAPHPTMARMNWPAP